MEAPAAVSLTPNLGHQAVHGEAQPIYESQLQKEIRSYRAHEKLEAATTNVLRGLDNPGDFFDEAFFANGDLESAVSRPSGHHDAQLLGHNHRRMLRIIERSEGRVGLYQQARALKKDESIALPIGDSQELRIKKFADNAAAISYSMARKEGGSVKDRKSDLQDFKDRLDAQTEKYRTTRTQLAEGVRAGNLQVYANEVFSFSNDFDDLGRFVSLFNSDVQVPASKSFMFEQQALQDYLTSLPTFLAEDQPPDDQPHSREGIYLNTDGKITKLLIGDNNGAYLGLKAVDQKGDNLNDMAFRVGVEIDPAATYQESDFNGKFYPEATPFIESGTATAILTAFEAAGLRVTSEIKDAFAEAGSFTKRYGNGYAEVTREIGKLVNDPDRGLSRFFADDEKLAEKVASLSHADDRAAEIALGMLRDVVTRGDEPDSDLPVSSGRIDVRDGSCMDIETYLATGHEVRDAEANISLFQSSYKLPRLITLQPLVFNGVSIPTGSLLARENDGYLLLRPTGFTFDDQETLAVFGQQEAMNRRIGYKHVLPSLS